MSTTVAEERMTAAEFLKKYGHCSGVELVRGRVVWAGREHGRGTEGARVPHFKHGVVCHNADILIGGHVRANNLGRVAVNDTFVPIATESETVRGADLLFVGFNRLPAGPAPDELSVPPDLVVEVRSPTNRWVDVFTKIGEYLSAGVAVVVILDPKTESASVYRPDEFQQIFHNGDELTLPDVLPGFAVPVRRFFE